MHSINTNIEANYDASPVQFLSVGLSIEQVDEINTEILFISFRKKL